MAVYLKIWKSNVSEFDLAELYLIPTCVFGPNPAVKISVLSQVGTLNNQWEDKHPGSDHP